MELKNVCKSFLMKTEKIEAIKNINLKLEKGKFYAIVGHSGSGKSTLINILGTLTLPDSGEYMLNGLDVKTMNDFELSKIRLKTIGFIFQDYSLDPHLKAFENIMLPMIINRDIPPKIRKQKAIELLKNVGLLDRMNHYPKQLSGGEQQRVAIARSLANNPDIILADEPTGNLDIENEKIIFKQLKELTNQGKIVIVVTHSTDINQYADVVLKMTYGQIEESK